MNETIHIKLMALLLPENIKRLATIDLTSNQFHVQLKNTRPINVTVSIISEDETYQLQENKEENNGYYLSTFSLDKKVRTSENTCVGMYSVGDCVCEVRKGYTTKYTLMYGDTKHPELTEDLIDTDGKLILFVDNIPDIFRGMKHVACTTNIGFINNIDKLTDGENIYINSLNEDTVELLKTLEHLKVIRVLCEPEIVEGRLKYVDYFLECGVKVAVEYYYDIEIIDNVTYFHVDSTKYLSSISNTTNLTRVINIYQPYIIVKFTEDRPLITKILENCFSEDSKVCEVTFDDGNADKLNIKFNDNIEKYKMRVKREKTKSARFNP